MQLCAAECNLIYPYPASLTDTSSNDVLLSLLQERQRSNIPIPVFENLAGQTRSELLHLQEMLNNRNSNNMPIHIRTPESAQPPWPRAPVVVSSRLGSGMTSQDLGGLFSMLIGAIREHVAGQVRCEILHDLRSLALLLLVLAIRFSRVFSPISILSIHPFPALAKKLHKLVLSPMFLRLASYKSWFYLIQPSDFRQLCQPPQFFPSPFSAGPALAHNQIFVIQNIDTHAPELQVAAHVSKSFIPTRAFCG